MNKKILPILLLAASMYASEQHNDIKHHPHHKIFKEALKNVNKILDEAMPAVQTMANAQIITKKEAQGLVNAKVLFSLIEQNADGIHLSEIAKNLTNHKTIERLMHHGVFDGK